MMKLHDHKWHVVANRAGRIWARCKITCREELDLEQIDAMLNKHAELKRGNEALRNAMWDCYALLPPERVEFVAKKTQSTLKEQA